MTGKSFPAFVIRCTAEEARAALRPMQICVQMMRQLLVPNRYVSQHLLTYLQLSMTYIALLKKTELHLKMGLQGTQQVQTHTSCIKE